MDLAGRCQGVFHCRSLSAWSAHDTNLALIILAVLAVAGIVAKMTR